MKTRIKAAFHCLMGTEPKELKVMQIMQRTMYFGEKLTCRSFKKFIRCGGHGKKQMLYVISWRDRFKCRICNEPAHNVHHILKRVDYPHWSNEVNNMISLCKKHHLLADNGEISVETLFNLIPTE